MLFEMTTGKNDENASFAHKWIEREMTYWNYNRFFRNFSISSFVNLLTMNQFIVSFDTVDLVFVQNDRAGCSTEWLPVIA